MTNVETVKRILPSLPSSFTLDDIYNELQQGLSRDQIGKALRSIDYVTVTGKAKYHVRGRRTVGNGR